MLAPSLVIAISGCTSGDSVEGNGVLKRESIFLPAFGEIEIATATGLPESLGHCRYQMQVGIYPGSTPSAQIAVEENLQSYVSLNVVGDRLVIRVSKPLSTNHGIKVSLKRPIAQYRG
jgi:hypothetical protein